MQAAEFSEFCCVIHAADKFVRHPVRTSLGKGSLPMIKMLMIFKLMTRNSAQAMRTFFGHVAL
jgi:hypothetical protein